MPTAPTFRTVHPARPGTRDLTAADLLRVPRVGAPVPAPDGSTVVVPVTTYDLERNRGTTRLHLVPAAGGDARALTSAEHDATGPAFSPDGRRLAYVRRPAGEKDRGQVHVLPLDGGEPERVTDLPLGAFDPRWLPDGSGLVFGAWLLRGFPTPEATRAEAARRESDPVKAYATEEHVFRYWDQWLVEGRVPHLFVLDLATRSLRDLMPGSTDWFDWMEPQGNFDVSPDGAEVAFAAIRFDPDRSLLRTSLHVVATDGSRAECLRPDNPARDFRPRYTADGRHLVYGSTLDPHSYADRVRLHRFDRERRVHEPLLADWDLSPTAFETTPDGEIALLAERDARVSLFRLAPGGSPEELVAGGTLGGLRVGRGGELHFTRQSLSEPPEAHACDARGGGLRRLTRFTEDALRDVRLGEVREVQFDGAAGERVQAWVVLPPDPAEVLPAPLVHVVHGGPHGISGDQFHFRWNAHAFAAPGYVAALVNFQGSTSWGQDFAHRIQGAWGERPFEDVMRATDVLVDAGLADPRRMAAAGGSYGGYLVAWLAGHTDRFRCIVNHAGVFDSLGQWASDVTQGRAKALGGSPWEGLENLDRWNPVRSAATMDTPMLVLHGERDYRVPVTQGLLCYSVLKARGVPARLVYFPDEGHWVLKPRNSLLWYREVLDWLSRYLGTAEATT